MWRNEEGTRPAIQDSVKDRDDILAGRTITLPAKDVYVIMPLGIFDKELELIFRTDEAIDSAIEQLQRLKTNLHEKETDS